MRDETGRSSPYIQWLECPVCKSLKITQCNYKQDRQCNLSTNVTLRSETTVAVEKQYVWLILITHLWPYLPVIFAIIEWNLDFLNRFSKNTKTTNSVKIRPAGAELFHADRQTDKTKLIVAFRKFCECAWNRISENSYRNNSIHGLHNLQQSLLPINK